MTGELVLAWAVVACALVPAWVSLCNVARFRPPPDPAPPARRALGPVSVLVPARDEEAAIGDAVASILASEDVELEVVVLDDGSRDRTAEIVAGWCERDSRVRLETAPPLPAGWCGKQHACAVLARLARHPTLVFMDADVRLEPRGLAGALTFLDASGAALVSGFPRQVTGTWLEKLLIPLIHFVLLGFLPMGRMRRSSKPAYGAGCGQLMIVDRAAYGRAGGHAALRASRHDGVALPRVLRRRGFATDLFDATDVAWCRMYHGAREVWAGLAKNATEGLGAPGTIVPATLLLVVGQVLPLPLLLFAAIGDSAAVTSLALAVGLSYLPRLVAVRRFRQPWLGALAHPIGVALLLVIQWQALGRELLGRPAQWRGRTLPVGAESPSR